MKSISLGGTDWTLICYWQHFWKMGRAPNAGFGPAGPPMPACVPGAVHADLLAAGRIPDWQDGLNAAQSEWVNNREWELKRTITVPTDFNERLTLECDGLDYSGHILIDGKIIGDFEGTHFRHNFDISSHARPGQTYELSFIFHIAPQLDAQIGYTSKTRIFKPRFGYCWDWTPRLINVGIWQDVRLVCRGPGRFGKMRILPRLDDDLRHGRVTITGRIEGEPVSVRATLRDHSGQTVATNEQKVGPGQVIIELLIPDVRPWWPATLGDQPLYGLTIELLDDENRLSDLLERTIGFKRVCWLSNPGAPSDAEPNLCEVNGRLLLLRGVNWVPLSPLYGTVTAKKYEAFLRLYQRMNVNLLRVWGGGILETPAFYDLCDRLGLLVWQEFPLSSSGLDNWPPEEPETIEHLQAIATEYVERRGHHASHLLWCGGNELQGNMEGGKIGVGRPVDLSHPLMARWKTLIDQLDPGKRFLPTSPTGPRFYAELEEMGKGVHQMVHGPWANLPLVDRYTYFNRDDASFRSEVGAPGCSSLAALQRHCGDQPLWPPTKCNLHWLIPGALWAPWDDVTREFGPLTNDPSLLPTVVKASRYLQAESSRYVAESVRRRFPRCGGLVIWMGHDCIHCTANNSLVQIDGSAKPAFDWLQKAWGPWHVSLRHDAISYPPGEHIRGEAWIHCDKMNMPVKGNLAARVRLLDGTVVQESSGPAAGRGPGFRASEIDLVAPNAPYGLFVLELLWQSESGTTSNRYLLSRQTQHPLAPMLTVPPARIGLSHGKTGQCILRNESDIAALATRLITSVADVILLASVNNFIMFPGEAQAIDYELIALSDIAIPYENGDAVTVEMFNQ